METKRGHGLGLAARMVAVTMSAVAVAIVAIGTASVGGVFSLARSEDASRLAAYRRLAAENVSGTLTLVSRTVEQMGTSLTGTLGSSASARSAASAVVARAERDNAEYLQAVALTDASGTVLAASGTEVASSLASLPGFGGAAARSRVTFLWQPRTASTAAALWALRRAGSDSQGRGLVVAALVRRGSMRRMLDEVAAGARSRSAYIVADDGLLVETGATSIAYPAASASFTGGGRARTGRVSATAQGFGSLAGYYERIDSAPELGWRIVVLDAENDAMARAWHALAPAAIATLASALLAFVASALFARGLVAPLALFERRAREVAAGGYVKPLVIERTDELGRLAEAFNDMGVRLNSLQDVAHLLAGAADIGEVHDAVLTAVTHLLGTGDAAVLLLDTAGDLVLTGGRGLREPGLRFSVPLDETSPLTAAVRDRRVVPFEGRSARWSESVYRLFDADQDRSGVAVPLVVGQEAFGVLVALAPGRRPLTEAQIDTARAFSAQAAVAVRTSRLFEHEHVSRREAEGLREVAELIAGTRDLGDALDRVAAVAADLLGMAGCAVAIADRSEFGLGPSEQPAEERRFLDEWRDADAARGPGTSPYEPLVVSSREDGEDVALLMVPLARHEVVRGVLALWGRRDEALAPQRIALAGTLGKEVSLALDNAALLQEARSRAANLETVFRISQAVSSSLQINVVLNRVLDVVQKIFSADAATLMAYDATHRAIETSMARGVASRDMLYLQVAPGEDIPGTVFDTHTPVRAGDLSAIDTPLARMALAQGMRSLAAVPLLARGRSTGVLTVYDRRPDAFSAQDMELLLTFASQAALALDTAALYSHEHHVASVLQASILPESLPRLPGLETGSFYLPAGLDAEIGGDYYDLFATKDGGAVVAIADVCGKGVLAATKTSMIRYSLRGMVAAGATPGEALSELNRAVAEGGDPSDIMTAWVGRIDPERRTLAYAGGGHPPALLRRAGSGVVERLGPTGPLIGALANATYEEAAVSLAQDDLLLVYTDGVTEARRGARFFGEGRVARALRSATSAPEVAEALLAALAAFSADLMRDDAAALAVRLTGGREDAQRPAR